MDKTKAFKKNLDKLPVPYRKLKTVEVNAFMPVRQRVFTEWSSKYQAETYCLLPYRPISKMFTKNITNDH